MNRLIVALAFTILSHNAIACSYCKKSVATPDAAAAAANAGKSVSTLGGSGAITRVIAAKSALDTNFFDVKAPESTAPAEQQGLRKGNTEEFETDGIFAN